MTDPGLIGLRAGHSDKRGQPVTEILWNASDFVIYRAKDGVFPCFADDPEVKDAQIRSYLSLGANLSDIEHLRTLMESRKERKAREATGAAPRSPGEVAHDREMARCLAQALTGNIDEAKAGLDALHERWASQNRNRVRVVHLAVNLFVVLAVVAVALGLAWSNYNSVFGFNSREMALVGMMGAIGALFSTTVRLQSMEVDPTVQLFVHIVYGLQRVMVGVLGALVLYFAIRAGVLVELMRPGISDGDPAGPVTEYEVYWLSFVCVLAGFSERLVPNLLTVHAGKIDPKSDPPPA